jgi:hypothetical protein
VLIVSFPGVVRLLIFATGVDREVTNPVPLRLVRVDTLFATSELMFALDEEMELAVKELVRILILDRLFVRMELVFTAREDTVVIWVVDRDPIASVPGTVKFPLASSK